MLKVIILDDEQNAIDALQDMLEEYKEIEIVDTFTNPTEALDQMRELSFDAVFLDIEMPGMNGLETAEVIMNEHPDKRIVFVTAYDQYAVDAFEVNAIDYLLKPVRHSRMAKTVAKLVRASDNTAEPQPSRDGRILCFGAFQLAADPLIAQEVKWRTNKVRELFAYLAHQRGVSVHKERIMEDIWSGMDIERATTYLHTCIYQIRKTIKKCGLSASIQVTYNNDRYTLLMHDVYCDMETFMCFVDNKPPLTSATIREYEQAAALYRGHYLEDYDYAWAVPFREELLLHYAAVVKDMAVYYMHNGDYPRAVAHLRQLIANDPLKEEHHALLLQCYAEMGDRASLAAHYRHAEQLFQEELGVGLQRQIKLLYGRLEE